MSLVRWFSDKPKAKIESMYDRIFTILINSENWSDESDLVDETTVESISESIRNVNIESEERARDYLFKYTSSEISTPLLEIRAPAFRSENIITGVVSYRVSSSSMPQFSSTDIHSKINKCISMNLVVEKEGIESITEGEDRLNSEILRIHVSPNDDYDRQFKQLLNKIEFVIRSLDSFYNNRFEEEVLDVSEEFAIDNKTEFE